MAVAPAPALALQAAAARAENVTLPLDYGDRVANLHGGLSRWEAEGYRLEGTSPA